MRIDDANSSAAALAGAGLNKTKESDRVELGRQQNSRAAAASAGSGDSIELSGLAAALSGNDPVSRAREARIEKLQSDFAAGRYQADPEAVSRRIVEDALG